MTVMSISCNTYASAESSYASAESSKPDECSICLYTLERPFKVSCSHEFHSRCLSRLVSQNLYNCPLCRHPFSKEEISYFKSGLKSRKVEHLAIEIRDPHQEKQCYAIAWTVCIGVYALLCSFGVIAGILYWVGKTSRS